MDIILSPMAHSKIKCFINSVDTEISGMGKSHMNEDGDIVVDDIVLLKQTCSGASTNITADADAKFIYEKQKAGEEMTDWNIWWHSHVDMRVFWSTTDTDTIMETAGGAKYLISIVGNKKGEYKARLDLFPEDTTMFKRPIVYTEDDLDVVIQETPQDEKLNDKIEEVNEEIDDKIEEFQDKMDVLREQKVATLESKKKGTLNVLDHCLAEIADKVEEEKPTPNIFQKCKNKGKTDPYDFNYGDKGSYDQQLKDLERYNPQDDEFWDKYYKRHWND